MESKEKAWTEKTGGEKALTVAIFAVKILLVCALIYMFIISLGLMGSAFKILGGKTAGATFRNNELFDNPVAGLMMGILATVLVQSSSTSTSIIITMTAAGLMEVKNAIPMIMGANIGTSVTNTIVSLAQAGDKDEYRLDVESALDLRDELVDGALGIGELLGSRQSHLHVALRVKLVVVNSGYGARGIEHVRFTAAEQAEQVLFDADLVPHGVILIHHKGHRSICALLDARTVPHTDNGNIGSSELVLGGLERSDLF